MASSRARQAISVSIAALVAIIVVGCAAGPDPDPSPTPRNAATSETASPVVPPPPSLPSLSDLPVGTVIATGTFDSRDVTGRIEIRSTERHNGMQITLSEVSPAPPEESTLELNSLPSSASDVEFAQAFSYFVYDVLQATSEQTLTTPGEGYGGFRTNDPGYLRTAVIYGTGGFGDVFATAALTWNLPNMNPSLQVTDAGKTEHARGAVTVAEDGTPLAYRVAAGDTLLAITARFGITGPQLGWLNPDRSASRLILADLTLNLSRENRGLRG